MESDQRMRTRPKGIHTIHRPLEERYWEKVAIREGCWEWQAHCSPEGYGQFKSTSGKGMRLAHRVMFRLVHGRDPVGPLLHSCDNPPCQSPDHVREGTALENSATIQMVRTGRYNSNYRHGRRCAVRLH